MVIKLGGKSAVMVSHHGFVYISGSKLNALYIPTFRVSLLSANQLDRAGALSTFGRGASVSSSGGISISGTRVGDLYIVNTTTKATTYTSENTLPATANTPTPATSESPEPATSASRPKGKRESGPWPKCDSPPLFPELLYQPNRYPNHGYGIVDSRIYTPQLFGP